MDDSTTRTAANRHMPGRRALRRAMWDYWLNTRYGNQVTIRGGRLV